MTAEQEVWKPVKDYENLYEISNLGRLRSLTYDKLRKFQIKIGGYLGTSLCKENVLKNVRVHRLVAETFVPNPQSKSQVNHINGNKPDNRAINLEWVTSKENIMHAINTGLFDEKSKKHSEWCKKQIGEKSLRKIGQKRKYETKRKRFN